MFKILGHNAFSAITLAISLQLLSGYTYANNYEAGKTYDNYPPLKEIYKDYFTVGMFGNGTGGTNVALYNYAAFSPGNEMKPESIQKNKGEFTWKADSIFNTYKGMVFYGHTLTWHSQTPDWFWDQPHSNVGAAVNQFGSYDNDIAAYNLSEHIEQVMGRYGANLVGMDVVNEAINGTPNPNDWQGSLIKGDGWVNALGWQWVELAFLKAAEVVDRNGWDCKLIINDFGLDSPAKAGVMYEMVKDINERYAGIRPQGKQLIEVIGMQAHYNPQTKAADVENSIKLFATLPGVEINITEMDIGSLRQNGQLTKAGENNQAMLFAELFNIYKKYATGSANVTENPRVISRVSISGNNDATTGWRAGEFALLFTSNGLAKQSLIALLDTDNFLTSNSYISMHDRKSVFTPGIHVYNSEQGDNYTGANIILGNNAHVWPFAQAAHDNKIAFEPIKDAKYRLTVNVTPAGTTSIRIRWIKDNENGGYTANDAAIVNNHTVSANQVATVIPAYFNKDLINMGNHNLITEVVFDSNQNAEGLIGNIAIRGGGGGNAYVINAIKVEQITETQDILLTQWPDTLQ